MKINTDTTRRIGLIVILGLSVALLDIKLARAETEAESNSGLYVLGQLGLAAIPDIKMTMPGTDLGSNKLKHKSGLAFGGAVGYKINYVRLELEAMFTGAEQDMGELSNFNITGNTLIFTLMPNIYVDLFDYDFNGATGRFVPYMGVGAGYAGISFIQEASIFGVNIKEEATVYSLGLQGMLGFKYFINDKYAIDFKYKLLVVPWSNFETNYKEKFVHDTFLTSVFTVGLSYSF